MDSLVGYLRSHTLTQPSSAPDANRLVVIPFQEMTLTSQSCAWMSIYDLLLLAVRVSHTRTVPSTEQDAKANDSTGDHWMSSTDSVW